MNASRQKYWIAGAGNGKEGHQKLCSIQPFQYESATSTHGQTSSQHLPTEPITPANPFNNTGMDLAGPFFIRKDEKQQKLRFLYVLRQRQYTWK